MAAVHAEQLRTLRETQARLRALIENEPECVKLLDRDGRLLEMNAAGLRMIEADAAAQVVGRCVYGLIAPEHTASFRALTERVCAGEHGKLEFEVIGLRGTRRRLETHAVPFRDEASGETRLLAITRDVTERSRLGAALRESEQRFRLFMQHAPAAAWIKDAHLRYSYVNRGYEVIYGRGAPQVLGRDDFELHDADRAKVFREEDQRIRASGQAEQKMHALPYADGRPGHWLVVKFPLEGGVGGIGIDVTPRLEAEDKARRYAGEVRDLAKRLVQAQEAERRRIAGGLHDLIGQNLTALGIDLQALKQRLQPGSELASAARIDAMAALVETTIDAIRDVMTDLHPPALEEFGLAPALRWHAAQFAQRTAMKVVTRVQGRERRLAADAELALFRIAQEALTNAAKHSGGTAIEVRIDYGDAVRLTVADDGSGFSEREGARAARRGGFGLSTMRERAEAIGGCLRVEFPGRGTRLVVEVP